jgi:hypothetical protein
MFPERRTGSRKERTVEYREEFARAKRVARAKLAFYVHLVVFVVVNALLIGINLTTPHGRLWFKWPLLGWGIGVLGHAVLVFVLPRWAGVQRRMIERELRRSARKKP